MSGTDETYRLQRNYEHLRNLAAQCAMQLAADETRVEDVIACGTKAAEARAAWFAAVDADCTAAGMKPKDHSSYASRRR